MRRRALTWLLLGASPVALVVACGLEVTGAYPSFDAGADGSSETEDAPFEDARVASDAAPLDGGADVATDASPEPPGVQVTVVADASLAVDLVSPMDGPIATDGTDDGAFDVTVTGPARAFALLLVDDAGTALGTQIWDTYVGDDDVPADLATVFAKGAQTFQLGVFRGDALVNDDAGRAALPAGSHTLRISGSNVGSFASGQHFRLVLETEDGGLVRGPVVGY